MARFAPNSEIAAAWDRLISGDFIQNDIKLLEHELYEATIKELKNLDYRTAHNETIAAGKLWDYPEFKE